MQTQIKVEFLFTMKFIATVFYLCTLLVTRSFSFKRHVTQQCSMHVPQSSTFYSDNIENTV